MIVFLIMDRLEEFINEVRIYLEINEIIWFGFVMIEVY